MRNAYDDGDGRWDVQYVCNICGDVTWSAYEEGWQLQDLVEIEDEADAFDLCPKCSHLS